MNYEDIKVFFFNILCQLTQFFAHSVPRKYNKGHRAGTSHFSS